MILSRKQINPDKKAFEMSYHFEKNEASLYCKHEDKVLKNESPYCVSEFEKGFGVALFIECLLNHWTI